MKMTRSEPRDLVPGTQRNRDDAPIVAAVDAQTAPASAALGEALAAADHAGVAASASPAVREAAIADLHALLLRGARFELARRRALLADVPRGELDRLAVQAADDAMVAILATLDSFRGASRFTTWAYKFVLLEAGVSARRRAWAGRDISVAVDVRETPRAIRELVQASLTPHQQEVFAALALNGVPIDVLAERLSTTRSALYATLQVARRKLRAAAVEAGVNRAD
jgi:RNA polymerase sigma-70 factor (ECF subfamily)